MRERERENTRTQPFPKQQKRRKRKTAKTHLHIAIWIADQCSLSLSLFSSIGAHSFFSDQTALQFPSHIARDRNLHSRAVYVQWCCFCDSLWGLGQSEAPVVTLVFTWLLSCMFVAYLHMAWGWQGDITAGAEKGTCVGADKGHLITTLLLIMRSSLSLSCLGLTRAAPLNAPVPEHGIAICIYNIERNDGTRPPASVLDPGPKKKCFRRVIMEM